MLPTGRRVQQRASWLAYRKVAQVPAVTFTEVP